MPASGLTRSLRDAQRSIDQLRAQFRRDLATRDERSASLEASVAALRGQLGAIEDSDDDGLPDVLDLDGGGA